ncbi:MAG: hypothetical protein KBC72_00400 [Acinetobacter sp.]|nr:hypothetical protein [Acinetobacter sp.]
MTREEFKSKFKVGDKVTIQAWKTSENFSKSWIKILFIGEFKFFGLDDIGVENKWDFNEAPWQLYEEPKEPERVLVSPCLGSLHPSHFTDEELNKPFDRNIQQAHFGRTAYSSHPKHDDGMACVWPARVVLNNLKITSHGPNIPEVIIKQMEADLFFLVDQPKESKCRFNVDPRGGE